MSVRIQVVEHAGELWPRVRTLLARTPMGGALPVMIQRAEREEDAYLTLGGTTLHAIAEENGKVVGFAHGAIERRLLWNGRALVPEEILIGGDLRIAPEARGRGILRGIFDAVREAGAARGVVQGWGLINEGNSKQFEIMLAGKLGHVARVVRTFTTATRLFLAAPKRVRQPRLERYSPTAAELERLTDSWSHRFLAPAPGTDALARASARFPEMQFYRLRESGEHVTALWNPHRARRISLASTPLLVRSVRAAQMLARPLLEVRSIPKRGEPVETVELTFCVRERLDANVLDELANEAFELGAHVFNVPESGLDVGATRWRVRGVVNRLRTNLLTYAAKGAPAPECPPELPVFLELAFL